MMGFRKGKKNSLDGIQKGEKNSIDGIQKGGKKTALMDTKD